ncbi:TetR/AcrR family transcriptional regulator [Lactiplantibacillus mudanjiangensis]|uniref:HTH tetR-type domain-containing protein n=1 Tax=Lactiplantibacillus mudanjiangensis TaxID=1296538 RepID=A0A660E1V0_9LACO|nr:TetR/AcrR family transcriptional regulator C-terminal domain-containing protein [Lactiplantibacillus mudanjiangensis]VDG25475.1 hypothetical protein [Lactobacillus koreensis] [Lactiplantibacillus mudanjiangensis]VDG28560.1 hypothetical protein [Lactobacillus koreensis] [Lactiplantibacillus mudanjiangensis]
MADRRIIRTEQQITDIFFTKLATKPLSKISVSEITRAANINRSTFYLHYQDVFDLYQQVTQTLINDLAQVFDTTYPDDEVPLAFLTLAENILTYLQNHQHAFKILLKAENSANFIDQIRQLFINKVIEKEHISANNHDYIIDVNYNVNGALGVITAWEKDELDCSIDVVIKRLAEIFAIL